jgi:hypothetical protein
MAVKNLQSLVLHTAAYRGACATGLERKVLFTALGVNPAKAPSLPWHLLPGPSHRIGTQPDQSPREYSMDSRVRRAGRSASVPGVLPRFGFARSQGLAGLTGWPCLATCLANRMRD